METRAPKILVVTPDFPYPPNHGARVDMWGRIKVLAKLGYQIDLISTGKLEPSPTDLAEVKKYVGKITCLPRKNRLIDLFSPYPLPVVTRKALRSAEINEHYDIVLLETEHVYLVIDNPGLTADCFILRLHNDEPLFFRELARSVSLGVRKLYYLLEAYRFARLKPLVLNRVPNLLFISEDEYKVFNREYSGYNCLFLPPPLSGNAKKHSLPAALRRVLFVGSLFMVNNKEAVDWYLSKVHHLLQDIEEYEFVVAGNSRGENPAWLAAVARQDKVAVYDSPPELDRLYATSRVFVNPMQHGAGVKLKIIEAILNGLPVVTTPTGCQGTGLVDGRDILRADEPAKFAAAIRKLLLNPDAGQELVDNAQAYLGTHYNQEKIIGDYLAAARR